jgi:hypothetical protein
MAGVRSGGCSTARHFMLVSTIKDGRRVPIGLPLEEHPDIHWRSFSILFDLEDMPRLPEILARVTPADQRRMAPARDAQGLATPAVHLLLWLIPG